MTSMIRRSPLRTKLALTTALAGSFVAFAGAAHAQNTPTTPTVVNGIGVTFNGGGAGNADGTPTNLNVNLQANPATIIDWAGFSVANGSTVNFNSSLGVVPAAVLNRVTGPSVSDIQGSITSSANVAVWLLNPNGILIGGSGSISTGSFVGSTLGIANADFIDLIPSGNYSLTGAAGLTSGITIANGATITTANGNRGLVLVAPVISAGGADNVFDAGGRDVAFITATDVTLNYGILGGPLQVTIERGTAVGGASQIVGGTVDGRAVYFALASQAAVTDALLNVDALVTATTAAATSTGIVLAAGTGTGPISLGGGDVAGVGAISANGSLTATGPNGEIAIRATSDIAGAVNADASQGFSAVGQAVALGAITADDAVDIDANGIFTATSLNGDDGVTIDQAGAFSSIVSGAITSSNGGLRADGGSVLTLGSIDVDGAIDIGGTAPPGTLTINGSTDAGGAIDVRTTGAQSYALAVNAAGGIDLASSGGGIVFGASLTSTGSTVDVDANGALTVAGVVSASGAADLEGASINVSDVTSINGGVSLNAVTGALDAGAIDADDDIGLSAGGTITILGNIDGDNVDIAAAGDANIAANVTAAGDYTVSGTTIRLGDDVGPETQQATGIVTISATNGGISGGAGLTLRSNSDGAGPGALTLETLGASGGDIGFAADSVLQGGSARQSNVQVRSRSAANVVQLGGVSASALTGAVGAAAFTNGLTRDASITVGDVNLVNALRLRSDLGDVSVGSVTVTGNNQGIDLRAPTGALTVPGSLSADGAITLIGANALNLGTIDSDDGAVVIQSTASSVTANNLFGNSVMVDAATSATIAGNVTAGAGDYRVTAASVALGVDAGAEVQEATGTVQISATGGSITGGQNLTLRAVGTGDLILTTAAGLSGGDIGFDATSLVQGGAGGTQRDVIIRSRTATNLVTLGDVTARGLLGAVGAAAATNGITRDASIVVDDVTLVNALQLTSTLGNVTTGAISVTGAGQGITLQAANGTLTAPGSLSASGNILLTGGNALNFGNLTSTMGSVSATSVSGALTTGTVSGQTGVTLAANGNLSAAAANAATGAVTLSSTTGATTLGNSTALGNIAVTAATAATINGNVTSTTGSYRVTGGTVSLGADPDAEVQQAGGVVDITATTGAISGGAGLTLRSGTLTTTAALVLDAAGGIALGGATVQGGTAGTAAIGLRAGLGQAIALGNTTGSTIGDVDATHTLFSSALARDASVTFGNVTATASGFGVTLSAGDITTGIVSAADVSLIANAGNVTMGGATAAGGVIVNAALAANVSGNVTSGIDYTVTGGSVNLGVDGDAEVQQAVGAVTITSNGGSITGGQGLTLRSNSDDAGGEQLRFVLGAGSGIAFDGTSNIQGGANRSSVIRIEAVDFTPSLVFGSVSGTTFSSLIGTFSGPNFLSTGGAVTTGNLDFSAELGIFAVGAVTTGAVNSDSFSSLSSTGGALTVNGPVTTGNAFTADGTSISFADSVTSGTSASFNSTGAITGTGVTAVGAISINGGSVDFTSATSTTAGVNASANAGDLAITTVSAGTTVTLTTTGVAAGDVRVDNATTAGLLTINSAGGVRGDTVAAANLTSTGGSIDVDAVGAAVLGTVNANQSIDIMAASISVASLNAANGSLTLNATGSGLTLGDVIGQTGVSLNALGDLSVASATSSAGAVSLVSSAGNTTLGSATAAGNVDVSAALTATVTDAVTSGANYNVTGGSVALGVDGDAEIQQAAGAVTIRATGGTLQGGTDLILRSDSDNAGGETLTLGLGAGANLAFGPATVEGGTNRSANIRIEYVGTAPTLVLGDVSGSTFESFDGLTTFSNFLDAGGGAVVTGDLDFSSNLIISDASSLTTGAANTDAAIILSSTGALATGGPVTAGTSASLSGASSVALGGGVTAATSVSVQSGGAITGSGIGSGTGLSVTGGSIDLDSLTSTGGAVSAIANSGDLRVGTVNAATTATLSTTGGAGDIFVDSVNAAGQITVSSAGDAGGDSVTRTDLVSTAGNVGVTASNGSVSIGTGSGATGFAVTGNAIDATTLSSGSGALSLTAGTGGIALGTGSGATATFITTGAASIATGLTTNGSIGITAASAALAPVTSNVGSVSITTTGDYTGFGGGRADVSAASSITLAIAGNALIGTLDAATIDVAGASVDVTSATATGTLDMEATAGDLIIGTGSSGGQMTLAAANDILFTTLDSGAGASLTAGGDILGTTLTAVGAVSTSAGGSTDIANLTASGIAITAAVIDIADISTPGSLSLTSTVGNLTLGSGSAGTTATLNSAGDLTVTNALTAGGLASASAVGNATIGTMQGASIAATGASFAITTATSATSLVVGGTTGDVSVNGTAGTTATLTAGRDVIVDTGLIAGGAVAINAGRDARLAQVTATNGVLGITATGQVSGAVAGTRGNLVTGGAGSALTIMAGGTVLLGPANAANGVTISGGAVDVTSIAAGGGAINLGATAGDIVLGSGTTAATATLNAAGTATLGQITAGSLISVTANDATITGTQRAATVRFVNRTPASVTLRLGDGLSAGGFALSSAEIAFIDANVVELNGGTGAVEIGDLAFVADTGRTSLSVLTTGALDITGTLSGSGSGRLFRFGGDATATGMADQIRIVSTADAGGRLLFGTADVELAGRRIVMGLASQFVDTILGGTPLGAGEVTGRFISNPNSTLYNAALTGQVYGDQTTITANSMTVRFGEYALFQNSAAAGQTSGAILGGTTTSPVTPALTIDGSSSSGSDGFAMFGTINGVSGTAAALLGPSVIAINAVDPQSARFNGCLIGSGAGCLTSVVVQPALNVFDSSRLDVLRTAEDLSLPFDPVVGTNNESLFSGVAALDPGVTGDECAANPDAAECTADEVANEGETVQ